MRPWVYLLLFGALLAAGCSTSATNSSANLVDAQGNHPAGWISTHPSFVGAVGEACMSCHGEDLRGGISGVSCFTASFNGQACHAGGPAPANHQPVATWVNAHQGEAAALRPTFSGCNTALCHGATLQGAVGPSCFSPSFAGFLCHSGGPPPNFHVANWYVDHRAFAIANGTVSCATAGCHGATLHADPPAATGPSCFRATWGALSCHAGGPGTGGGPTVEGAHNEHLALGTIVGGTNVISCTTCHSGPGGPPEVSFLTPFPYTSQNGGPSAFDNTALTCSAVKCHGGPPLAPTPNWVTGTIDVATNAGCRLCHNATGAGPVQYNDLTNNVHPTHITHASPTQRNISCITCHDPLQLTPVRHFGGLTDNVFPAGAAQATIQASLAYNPVGGVNINSCNTGCH
jgi:predicted CxxxxCH...CXXCH cytochrome family protein